MANPFASYIGPTVQAPGSAAITGSSQINNPMFGWTDGSGNAVQQTPQLRSSVGPTPLRGSAAQPYQSGMDFAFGQQPPLRSNVGPTPNPQPFTPVGGQQPMQNFMGYPSPLGGRMPNNNATLIPQDMYAQQMRDWVAQNGSNQPMMPPLQQGQSGQQRGWGTAPAIYEPDWNRRSNINFGFPLANQSQQPGQGKGGPGGNGNFQRQGQGQGKGGPGSGGYPPRGMGPQGQGKGGGHQMQNMGGMQSMAVPQQPGMQMQNPNWLPGQTGYMTPQAQARYAGQVANQLPNA